MISLLDFEREEIKACAQAGIMNIQTLLHWDVCNHLKKGHTLYKTAADFRKSIETIKYIKKKCPDCSNR